MKHRQGRRAAVTVGPPAAVRSSLRAARLQIWQKKIPKKVKCLVRAKLLGGAVRAKIVARRLHTIRHCFRKRSDAKAAVAVLTDLVAHGGGRGFDGRTSIAGDNSLRVASGRCPSSLLPACRGTRTRVQGICVALT